MAKPRDNRPRTNLPDARVSPRFAGLVTFARVPRLEDVKPEHRPVDWAVLGVPFDGGVTFRPGTRFGPRAIREASQTIRRYSIEHDVDVAEALSIADAGDAQVLPFDLEGTLQRLAEHAQAVGDAKRTRVLALGGDHSITYALIKAAFLRRAAPKGGLALIHVDSHLDTVERVWESPWSHASPFRRAVEDGLVNPKRMISIGIKGPLNSAADLDFARRHGITILTQTDLDNGAGRKVLPAFLRKLGDQPTYLSFDIDAVDPAFAPGSGTLSPGGMTSREALALLRSMKGVNLAGADVVEVLPDRDPAGITALLAAQVAFEVLALDAAGR
jgi:agmatinase